MKTETILKKIQELDVDIEIYKNKRMALGCDFVAFNRIYNSLLDAKQRLVDNLDARGIKYNSSTSKIKQS